MSILARKALRDLVRERTRTTLVVLAIALGLAGSSAVLASYAVLTRELARGFRATDPAAFTLRLERVDDELLSLARADPAVREVEARRTLTGRIRSAPTQWRNLTLFAVPDFGALSVSRFEREEGAWPPARGEMLIERDAFRVAHAAIGDTLTLQLRDGSEHALRVAGRVHDAGLAQARMENSVYGYVALETLSELGLEPVADQLKVTLMHNELDREGVRAAAAELAARLEQHGARVLDTDVPPPGEHPHAAIMGLLLLSMAAFGGLVLVFSGVLVVNLLGARMATQVREIGVMKALGGARGRIARAYLGQALVLGAAAFVVGVPFGLWGSRVLSRALAVFLNFDLASLAVPAWVFGLVAAAALLVPLAAASVPVWKGCDVSVRAALADRGVPGSFFGASAFERALARIGAPRPLAYALRSAFRRRTRLVLTLATLAAGGVFFLAALDVRASLVRTLDLLFEGRRSDLSVTLAAMTAHEPLERALAATPGIARWEGWIATEAALAHASERTGGAPTAAPAPVLPGHGHGGGALGADSFPVLALPPESVFVARRIVAGRDLEPDERDAIVVNSALAAAEPALAVGSTVTLAMGPSELPWRVVGIAREPFAPRVAYVSRQLFDERGGHTGMANTLRLVLADTDPAAPPGNAAPPKNIDALRETLERNLAHEGVRALASSTKAESRYGFDQHALMLYVFLLVVAGLLACVGGLGLATSLSLDVSERRSELAVLRALGATPRALAALVVIEGLFVAALGWLLAALLAWPLARFVGDALVGAMLHSTLDFALEPRARWTWLALSFVLGALASFLPARHAARSPLRESLAAE